MHVDGGRETTAAHTHGQIVGAGGGAIPQANCVTVGDVDAGDVLIHADGGAAGFGEDQVDAIAARTRE